ASTIHKSSSLSVSSGFGNQFLNLSSDTSLICTTKKSADIEINSLLDIQIQQELKQVDHSPAILATIRSHVPAAVDKYLGSSLRDALQKVLQKHTKELIQQSSQKDVSEILKIKKEQAKKQQMPKYSVKSSDEAALDEYDQKSALFQTMIESKSFNKHPAYKALYHALMESLLTDKEGMDQGVVDLLKQKKRKHDDQDEDPSAGSNQGKKTKRRRTKDSESSKKSSASKGNIPPQTSKYDKPVHAKESVDEPIKEVIMDAANDNGKEVDDGQEQTWFNDLLSAEKIPITFDELMATPIDFSNFAMNRLKIDKLTKAYLVGLVYELLKGTCQSSIELEYNIEECYKALSDQQDWNNPEGDRFLFYLSKPLPLKGRPEKQYNRSITKTTAERYESQLNRFSRYDVYSSMKILSMKSVTVNKLHGYGYLEEIVVKRADRQMYKFKEGDFVNLHLNDIEDMLLLVVQHKLFHLNGEVIVDLPVTLRMFTRSLIIKKRVEDVQLGVESYQKKLNITKPQKDFPGISVKELYTPSFNPPGVFYADSSNRKRLM
ncbi:hypothetical protein Tco_0304383, partial [Tanacetum coccineum]